MPRMTRKQFVKIREIRGRENQEGVMNQIIDERRTNWFWIDNEVVDRFGPQIGAYGLAVYAALARFADGHTRIAFPAIPTIATQLSVHRSTVVAAIKNLENTDPPLITVAAGGGRTANTYTLNDLSPQMRDKDLPPSEHSAGTPRPQRGHPAAAPRAPRGHTAGTPRPHRGHPAATATRTILI